MLDVGVAIRGLWNIFRDQVAAGGQVYFCFSHEVLARQFLSSQDNVETLVAELSALANAYYEVNEDDVSVKSGAFAPVVDGFSAAIVLVCQQVLAVEEMSREPGGFSENAYFPRLRAMIDARLPRLSANPFGFDEFERVWRTFGREVRSIPGSCEELTFEFGVHAGVNKARYFPLSQALLSREDLGVLLVNARADKLRVGTQREVWTEIRRERYHLGRRAQRLIGSAFLQSRIVEQVQRYARRTPVPARNVTLGREGTSLVELELRIYKDVVDWSQEQFRAYLYSAKTGQNVTDDALLGRKIAAALAQHGYALLSQRPLGDWVLEGEQIEVTPGETLLVLGSERGLAQACASMRRLTPPLQFEFATARSSAALGVARVAIVEVPPHYPRGILINAGGLRNDTQGAEKPYQWLGGICLDLRSQKYLKEALPNKVRFADEEYSIEQMTRVLGHAMSYEGLCSWIERLKSDALLELAFPNGKSARLGIAVVRDVELDRVGYKLDQRGRLSAVPDILGQTDAALIGFTEPVLSAEACSLGDLAPLIIDLRQREGRMLTPEELSVMPRAVDHSVLPDSMKRALGRLLQITCRLRESTVASILAKR